MASRARRRRLLQTQSPPAALDDKRTCCAGSFVPLSTKFWDGNLAGTCRSLRDIGTHARPAEPRRPCPSCCAKLASGAFTGASACPVISTTTVILPRGTLTDALSSAEQVHGHLRPPARRQNSARISDRVEPIERAADNRERSAVATTSRRNPEEGPRAAAAPLLCPRAGAPPDPRRAL